jgi:MOSC domain-containing protein YiiM
MWRGRHRFWSKGARYLSPSANRWLRGPVEVGRLVLAGNEQADPSVHGRPDKAVHAYPTSHDSFWQAVRTQAQVAALGETLPFGALGENLSNEALP